MGRGGKLNDDFIANVLTSLSVKCFEIENRLAFGEVTVRSMVAFFDSIRHLELSVASMQ